MNLMRFLFSSLIILCIPFPGIATSSRNLLPQKDVICSQFIRISAPAKIASISAGAVFIQACREGNLHYLSFRIKDAAKELIVRFEVGIRDLKDLSAGRVRNISISFNAALYSFELNKNEGALLERLCAQVR